MLKIISKFVVHKLVYGPPFVTIVTAEGEKCGMKLQAAVISILLM